MAQVNTISGEQILVKIEDTPGSGTFTHHCLINAARGIQWTSSTNDDVVPDCANPENPAWVERDKDGLSAQITGAGKLHVDDVAFFDAWFRDNDYRAVQLHLHETGYWQGNFHLTEWGTAGERKQRATADVTLMSTGEVPAFITA